MEEIKVKQLKNGQFEVTHNNLKIIQTIIKGSRFNDCSIIDVKTQIELLTTSNNSLFKPLFIALHNYKNQSLKE